jgi:hypothetical protein
MRKLKKNEYQCDMCKGIFDKGWSDEEAKEEHFGRHPDVPLEETGMVCDPCYKILLKDIAEKPWKYKGLP